MVIKLLASTPEKSSEVSKKVYEILKEAARDFDSLSLWGSSKLDIVFDQLIESIQALAASLAVESTDKKIKEDIIRTLFKIALARGSLAGILSVFQLALQSDKRIDLVGLSIIPLD